MELEDKAKVVASVWLAELAVLPRSIRKNRMNSTFSFKYTRNKAKQLARQGIEQILPPKQTRPLPCLLIISFFYGVK